jgi:hypothetical protein
MPIETRWIDKESDTPIFVYEFIDRWTWTDIYNAIQTLRKDIDSMPYFDIIVDLTASKGIPSGALTHLRGLSQSIRADRWGICAMINADSMAKAMLQVLRSILPVFRDRFVFAPDIDNAIHEVKRWRMAHLPPKSAQQMEEQ